MSKSPSAPAVARRVFPLGRLNLAERYAELLATQGTLRGLIGPREVPRLWERHLVNCAVLGDWIPEGATVCDLGSGAGLPGLVLAIARPDLSITLVEPLLRRSTFLEEVVLELSLRQVEVVRARADALHGQRMFAVVTSRALAPLERLLGWSMPLVEPTGSLIAMKGSSVADEITAAEPILRRLGCSPPETRILGAGVLDSTTLAVRVSWSDPARVSWPFATAPATVSGAHARRKASKSNRRQGA